MKKKYKATAALAVSIAGALGTTGIAHSGFLGGMVHNGFLAATIGGLADWFAITALFRKPLGISYRTEIIIRNRQRIMQAVVDFAADDLLGTDNIMRFVNRQNLAGLLQSFAQNYGRERLMPYVERIGTLAEQQLDVEMLAGEMAPVVHGIAGHAFLERVAADVISGLSEKKSSRRLVHLLAAGLEELLQEEGLKRIFAKHLEELLQDYSSQVTSRAFLMGLLGLSGEKLADVAWQKAKEWLDTLAEDSAAEERAAQWLSEKLEKLSGHKRVVHLLSRILGKKLTEAKIAGMLQEALEKILSEGLISRQLAVLAEEYLDRFLTEAEWQQRADAFIKSWLARELAKHHDVIPQMIEERLGQLSDAELVEFTESKVADDLQMIRINGSVVGSLVGMGLFAVVYLTGQVMAP